MPITWCYEVADEDKRYCSASFPIGCFVTDKSVPMDACVISVSYNILLLNLADGIILQLHLNVHVRFV